jgi:hypothetical protein
MAKTKQIGVRFNADLLKTVIDAELAATPSGRMHARESRGQATIVPERHPSATFSETKAACSRADATVRTRCIINSPPKSI